MGKSLGITAFVLLLISLPIPVVGNVVSLIAVLILSFAAYRGEKRWVLITDVVAWVKMFLLSPTWHFMMFGGGTMGRVNRDLASQGVLAGASTFLGGQPEPMNSFNALVLFVTVAILAAPLGIMFWRSRQAPLTGSAPHA